MNDTIKVISLRSRSLTIVLGAFLVLNLTGCDTLARFTTKLDKQVDAPIIAEEQPAPIPESKKKKPLDESKIKPSPLYEWRGDGRSVTRIVVDTNEQKARFYEGEEELGWTTVATGLSKYPTPTGRFEVIEKVENKRSNLYGKVYGKSNKVIRSSVKVGRDTIPAGGRFEGARMPYWMRLTHDGIGLHAGAIPRPGSPASHGCIRMPNKIASTVFKHVAYGTSVEIVGKGPDYGDYVVKQRAIAAQRAAERKRAAEQKRIAASKAAEQQVEQPKTVVASSPTQPVSNTAPSQPQTVQSTAVAKDVSATSPPAEPSVPRETRMRTPVENAAPATDQTDTPQPSPTEAPSAAPVQSTPIQSTQTSPTAVTTPSPTNTPTPAQPAPEPQPTAAAAPEPTQQPAEKPTETPTEQPAKPILETKTLALPEPKAPITEKPLPAPSVEAADGDAE